MSVSGDIFHGFVSILPRDNEGVYATTLLPIAPPSGVTAGQMFDNFELLLYTLRQLGIAESELPEPNFSNARMLQITLPTEVLRGLRY